MELFEELEQEGIDRGLLEAIRAFRAEHPVPQEAQGRLIRPKLLYYGREVWQAAATALLCGENLLLVGILYVSAVITGLVCGAVF